MDSLIKIDLLDITKRPEQILKECEERTQVFIDGLRDDEVFYDASFDLANEPRMVESKISNIFDYKETKRHAKDRLGVYRHLLPFQADQSNVGDCWLIAALMALAQYPSAIKRIIPEGSYSLKHGIFLVRLFKEGEPNFVLLDGHFPIRDLPSFQFRFGLRGDMWAGLIEKAVAKEYGGYEKLDGGTSCTAFEILTGAPCVIYHMEEVKNVNAFWEKLVEFRSQNFPMAVSSKSKLVHPESDEDEGIHAFAVLDVCIRDGNRVILLGNSSDARKGKYETIPKLTKEQLDTIDGSNLRRYREYIEECLFWIDVQELIDFFRLLTVCRYRHGWYEKRTPKFDFTHTESCLRFHVGERCQMTIERTETDLHDSHVGFINIHKVAENGEVGEIVAPFQAKQFATHQVVDTDPFDLEPGDYILIYGNAYSDSTYFCYTSKHYWVFRSPTPLDHFSVWFEGYCCRSWWIQSENICQKSLLEMMKGRVGKEVQKGVFLRDYSMGNVVVLMAENKTEKSIAMDIIANSDDLIYSNSIPCQYENFIARFLFEIPAQSSKVLGCIIRYDYPGLKPKLKCVYKIRIHKARGWWSKKCEVIYGSSDRYAEEHDQGECPAFPKTYRKK